jgi:hypothetical protein
VWDPGHPNDLDYSSISSTGVGHRNPGVIVNKQMNPIASQHNPISDVSPDKLNHSQIVSPKPMNGKRRPVDDDRQQRHNIDHQNGVIRRAEPLRNMPEQRTEACDAIAEANAPRKLR